MQLTEYEVGLYGSKGPRYGEEIPGARSLKVLDVDSLIGPAIPETSYFETIEGDETNAGFFVVGENKFYLTKHTPTGSNVMYVKIWADFVLQNKTIRKMVWEVIPESVN